MTDAPRPIDATFDVAIIGGGIHGAGVAQASAARGLRTLLIDRADWANATSRASSKLIHGGLRYLESAQFGLVRHSLHERALLLRNAPALVHAVPFFIPVYPHTQRRPWQLWCGLALYAALAGLHPLARFRRVPRAEWPQLGGLRQDGLQAVFQYWDAQTDDAALTRAVVQSAQTLGAVCLPRCELLEARAEHALHTLRLRDAGGDEGGEWHCHARALVNAGGPWVNDVLERCQPDVRTHPLSWVKGTHIVLPPTDKAGIFYLEAPRDGRAIFVMPWQRHDGAPATLVGTTEVEVDTPAATPSAAEVDYLLETLRHYLPDHPATVLDSFAGVRVLPTSDSSPFSRARDSLLLRDGDASAPILSIFGGKLTTYRHTAEQVMQALAPTLGYVSERADTAQLPLTP
jgi:glycerol-3-phosphate dehydrogenase